MKDIPNEHAALLLIDMQRSFLDPEGGNYFAKGRSVVEPLETLLSAARTASRCAVFVVERHRPHVEDYEQAKLPRHCVDGEFDAELIDGFQPQGPNEFLLCKRRMSAFRSTDLDLLLRELGIRRLIIGGVKTNVCVRATVQDGFALGYECVVAKDGVASNREHLHTASLEDIERYMGWVVSASEACRLLT